MEQFKQKLAKLVPELVTRLSGSLVRFEHLLQKLEKFVPELVSRLYGSLVRE